jgi:alternate signal-mediated exported protein
MPYAGDLSPYDTTPKGNPHMGKTNQPRRDCRSRRNKGLVAGAIGLALLVGGGSTFAIWSDSDTEDVDTVSSTGVLDVTGITVPTVYDISGDAAGRTDTTALGFAGKPIGTPSNFKAVPKDTIEIDLSTTIKLEGDNMKAKLAVKSDEGPETGDGGTVPEGWTLTYWVLQGDAYVCGTSNTSGNPAATLLTHADGFSCDIGAPAATSPATYTVVITAKYDPFSTSSAGAASLDLGELTITVTQATRVADPAAPSG